MEPREQPQPTEEMREKARRFQGHMEGCASVEWMSPFCGDERPASDVRTPCRCDGAACGCVCHRPKVVAEAACDCDHSEKSDALSLLLAQVAEEAREEGRKAGMRRAAEVARETHDSWTLDCGCGDGVAEAIEREASR